MGGASLLHSAPAVPAAFPTAVTEADADLLRDLGGKLPSGWAIKVETTREPCFDWTAIVQGPGGLEATPVFFICRASGCVPFVAHWMDGSTFGTAAFTTLVPVLDLIPSGIFAGAEARLATVKAEGWQGVRH